jgi:hypothetical protein
LDFEISEEFRGIQEQRGERNKKRTRTRKKTEGLDGTEEKRAKQRRRPGGRRRAREMAKLEARDLEILRTLARVQFASSAELNSAFFSSESAGHRRFKKLADLGLIACFGRS